MQAVSKRFVIPGIVVIAALAAAALLLWPAPTQASHTSETPTNFAVAVLSETSVRLSWDGPERPGFWDRFAPFYTVNYEKRGSSTSGNVGSIGFANGGAETITGLDAKSKYRFRVRTNSTAGHNDSPWTAWVDVTMPTAAVSNLGRSAFGGIALRDTSRAQSFTTGGHSRGYTLASIEAGLTGDATDTSGLRAELWSASGGAPGSKLADLTNPGGAVAATTAFSALTSPTLTANTTYFFVLYTPGNASVGPDTTGSNDEDGGALDGWSIGDHTYSSSNTPGTWAAYTSLGVSFKIRVNAVPKPAPADLFALSVEGSGDGANFNALTGAAALTPAFDPSTTAYTATVGYDVTRARLTPVVADTGNATVSVDGTTVPDGTASVAISLDVGDNEIVVRVTGADRSTKDYTVTITRELPLVATVAFSPSMAPNQTFTVGRDADPRGVELTRLPEARVTSPAEVEFNATYSITGLPDGLEMGNDRIIRGAPTTATNGPVTVTYTANVTTYTVTITRDPQTNEITGATETAGPSGSASLTFTVTVKPTLAFAADEVNTFYGRDITYTAGQAAPLTVTLPEASGGTGTLTYKLLFNSSTDMAEADEPGAGVSLDPSTRVLTIDGASNVNRIPLKATGYAITYQAVDENGATATAYSSISVIGPPTLPDIDDQTFTAGAAVNLTLPESTGPWWNLVPQLSYKLEPKGTEFLVQDGAVALDVEGLAFRPGPRTITGTPTARGSTEMTYTVTDGNGVSATRTFTITVVAGPNAPSSAPANVTAGRASESGMNNGLFKVETDWDDVAGATGYVMQVRASGDSWPSTAVNSKPAGAHVSVQAGFSNGFVSDLAPGEYVLRVAAVNGDGAGPWSTEVSFTVQVGGL